MQNIKFFMIGIGIAVAAAGCGGLGIFDPIEPRAAVESDMNGQTFRFTWLPSGNPVDQDVSFFELDFGTFASGNTNFRLEELDGGVATGTVAFSTDRLTFTVTDVTGTIGIADNQVVTVQVDADETDGRLRLRSLDLNREATSDPED